ERLFLTRSSLVSLEIVPVDDPLKFVGTKRLAAPSDSFPPNSSVPSPFVLANDALPEDLHRGLIAHALKQEAPELRDGRRELDLGPFEQPVATALRSQIAQGGTILGVPEQVKVKLELRLLAIGDAQAVSWNPDPTHILHVVYHFHKPP